MKHDRSHELFLEAKKLLPGGVSSPVRAFGAVGGEPVFIQRGEGPYLYDVDDNKYIDFVCSWGALITGHAHPEVIKAVKSAAEGGTSFGAPTELEIVLAKMISQAMPAIEMVRFVNSGTEAAMSAIRLARAFTGRNKIVKFAGCYHGHSDGLLVKAGSGVASFGLPDSPGVPPSYTLETLVAPYNNLEALTSLFDRYGSDIAAVIVEPVAANMGVVKPEGDFISGLRQITRKYESLLIFDEVITGFRVSYGGAQALFGIEPDLTCLGKIIGGGLPAAAYGGRQKIMELVAPSGPVYQAGTLAGNPLAMAAGIKTLKLLSTPGVYEKLEKTSQKLEEGIQEAATAADIKLTVNRVASLLSIFFTPPPVASYDDAIKADRAFFQRFFHYLLENGIYWPPSPFESAFISLAHSEEDIDATLKVIRQAFLSISKD